MLKSVFMLSKKVMTDSHLILNRANNFKVLWFLQCFGSIFIESGSESRSRFAMNKNKKKLDIELQAPWRTYKLQKKPPALQREHLLLQNMKFLIFYMGDFCLPKSGSRDPTKSGSAPDADPKHWIFVQEMEFLPAEHWSTHPNIFSARIC